MLTLAGTGYAYVGRVAADTAKRVAQNQIEDKISIQANAIRQSFDYTFQAMSQITERVANSVSSSAEDANQNLGKTRQMVDDVEGMVTQIKELAGSMVSLDAEHDLDKSLSHIRSIMVALNEDDAPGDFFEILADLEERVVKNNNKYDELANQVGALASVQVVSRELLDFKAGRAVVELDAPEGYKFVSSGWYVPGVNGSESILFIENRPFDELKRWRFNIQGTRHLPTKIDVTVYAIAARAN